MTRVTFHFGMASVSNLIIILKLLFHYPWNPKFCRGIWGDDGSVRTLHLNLFAMGFFGIYYLVSGWHDILTPIGQNVMFQNHLYPWPSKGVWQRR